jgi:hypothetical protein
MPQSNADAHPAQLDRLTRARDLLIECEQIMMVS